MAMPDTPDSPLGRLIAAVMNSAKYADLDLNLVESVARGEAAKGRSFKETVKATRNKLHQVAAVYLGDRPDYAAWLVRLTAADDETARREELRTLMARHASTRERLPLLDTFYATVLADLGPIQTIMDLACGLNPLAWTWMPLAAGATYHALDVFGEQAAFLNAALALGGLDGRAGVWNLMDGPPPVRADVALLLKAIPCLEQLDKGIGPRLVEGIDAPVLVVSYPARSLGGRAKGMVETYARQFDTLVAGHDWRVTRFDFATELVFRIER